MNGRAMLWLDQWGQPYWSKTIRELCQKLGYARRSARPMYVDGTDGKSYRTGVVIGRFWLSGYFPLRDET
jgi:hypothetical protein